MLLEGAVEEAGEGQRLMGSVAVEEGEDVVG